jgi:multidrug efflux pump subunit AcrA (membrane-fusion protein)
MLLSLLAAGLLAGLWLWRRDRPAAAADPPRPSTAKAERGRIRVAVASTGRAVSNLDVEIKCKSSGQVVSLPYDVSDPVRKGEVVVELDPVDENRLLQQAQVALAISEARLEQARQSLTLAERNLTTERKKAEAAFKSAQARARDTEAKAERIKSLLDKKLSSEENYETAKTAAIAAAADLDGAAIRIDELKSEELALEQRRQDVRIAEAQVESNRIDLSIAQQRVKDTVVLAPMDGVVAARNVQIGQIISSGISNVGGGTTVLVLSDLSRVFVLASVDESDIGKVELDQPVRITADAYPGLMLPGKVVRIATRGVSTSNVVTFEVKIEVLGERKRLLKPEMTANVEIVAAEKDDALLVPSEALVRRRGQRFATVVKEDGTSEERPVETGLDDGAQVEITGGLSEGETVRLNKEESESRWRQGGDAARQGRMAQRILMGGGSGRGGSGRRGP